MYTFRVSFAYFTSVIVNSETKEYEEVLEKAVVEFEKTSPGLLWDVEEVENNSNFNALAPNAIYIDATMEGAKRPYYISEDVIIEQI